MTAVILSQFGPRRKWGKAPAVAQLFGRPLAVYAREPVDLIPPCWLLPLALPILGRGCACRGEFLLQKCDGRYKSKQPRQCCCEYGQIFFHCVQTVPWSTERKRRPARNPVDAAQKPSKTWQKRAEPVHTLRLRRAERWQRNPRLQPL